VITNPSNLGNFMIADIAAANAALIKAQGRVPIVEHWGEGLFASVDGLRFVVPKRTINAGPRRSTTTSSAASPGATP
jgi:TnpA family transposase